MDWRQTFEAVDLAIGRNRQAALESGKPRPPQRVSQLGGQTQAADEVPWAERQAPEAEDEAKVNEANRPTPEPMVEPEPDQDGPACRPAGCSAGASRSRGRPVQGRRRAPRRSGRLLRPHQAEAQREAEPEVDAGGGKAASRPAKWDSRRDMAGAAQNS